MANEDDLDELLRIAVDQGWLERTAREIVDGRDERCWERTPDSVIDTFAGTRDDWESWAVSNPCDQGLADVLGQDPPGPYPVRWLMNATPAPPSGEDVR